MSLKTLLTKGQGFNKIDCAVQAFLFLCWCFVSNREKIPFLQKPNNTCVLCTLTVHNSRAHISDTATNIHGNGGPYHGCQVSPVFRPQFDAEGSIKTE